MGVVTPTVVRAIARRRSRRLAVCLRALTVAAFASVTFLTPSPAAAAEDGDLCVKGTDAFGLKEEFSTPLAYGISGDLFYGQDLQPCAVNLGRRSMSAVLPANIAGPDAERQLVQLGLIRLSASTTAFYYTPDDSGGGSVVPAVWYPDVPRIGHAYRFSIWQTEVFDYHYGPPYLWRWQYCIFDLTVGHEDCTQTPRTWGRDLGSHESLTGGAFWMYETHDRNDRMGSSCCDESAIEMSDLSLMQSYMDVGSWRPMEDAALYPATMSFDTITKRGIAFPPYYKSERTVRDCGVRHVASLCTRWEVSTSPQASGRQAWIFPRVTSLAD